MLNKLGLLTMFLTFFNTALRTDEQMRAGEDPRAHALGLPAAS